MENYVKKKGYKKRNFKNVQFYCEKLLNLILTRTTLKNIFATLA